MVSVKQVSRWCPACRQQIRWNQGVLSLQMGENFLNNHSVFDAGDHFGRTAAGTACLNVVMNTRPCHFVWVIAAQPFHGYSRVVGGVDTPRNDRFRWHCCRSGFLAERATNSKQRNRLTSCIYRCCLLWLIVCAGLIIPWSSVQVGAGPPF